MRIVERVENSKDFMRPKVLVPQSIHVAVERGLITRETVGKQVSREQTYRGQGRQQTDTDSHSPEASSGEGPSIITEFQRSQTDSKG